MLRRRAHPFELFEDVDLQPLALELLLECGQHLLNHPVREGLGGQRWRLVRHAREKRRRERGGERGMRGEGGGRARGGRGLFYFLPACSRSLFLSTPVSYTHLTLPTSPYVWISVVAVSLKK